MGSNIPFIHASYLLSQASPYRGTFDSAAGEKNRQKFCPLEAFFIDTSQTRFRNLNLLLLESIAKSIRTERNSRSYHFRSTTVPDGRIQALTELVEFIPAKFGSRFSPRGWLCVCAKLLQSVRLFPTQWTVACQASLYGILQARIECGWPYTSRASSDRDRTLSSYVSCIGRQVIYY